MRRARYVPLVGACVAGCATVATATAPVPQAVQIVLGLLMVFLLPGFALVCATLPNRMSSGERLLASVGLSLTVATCAAVLLAATPVGLSRESLGVLLGGFTIVLSICGVYRSRSTTTLEEPEGPAQAAVVAPDSDRLSPAERIQSLLDEVAPKRFVRHRREARAPRVLVVGAGTHFLSAMSYYTIQLTNALAQSFAIAIIPMRQLIPTVLYPGRLRVGSTSTRLTFGPAVTVLRGIDWFWGLNLVRDLFGLHSWRPDVVIFQWWTGSVLHTYLAVALLARLQGASIIVECHEVLDTGEQRIPLARGWVRIMGRPFFGLADAFVIHSEADRRPIAERYRVGDRPCVVIPHGPIDHYAATPSDDNAARFALRSAPQGSLNLLFFGIIRPYKGLEDLVRAFELLDDDEVMQYWLTVVGETWEGWDLPIRLIERSRHRARITLVNRFVDDDEVTAYFADADAVVLPYHRSSASSPASVAMANGLPLILTAVGGLPEAVAGYEGAVLVPPRDPRALRDAIRTLPQLRGRRYSDPHSWDRSVAAYAELMNSLRMPRDGSPRNTP